MKTTSFFFSFFLLLFLFVGCTEKPVEQSVYNQGINLIPQPHRIAQQEGYFKLMKQATFYASTPEAEKVASYIVGKINRSTGYELTVMGDDGAEAREGIFLLLDTAIKHEEGYHLEVTQTKVIAKAQTEKGLFYAMQSFMQLLPAEIESPKVVEDVAWVAPCVRIEDRPRFGYRGIMLDPCRHFIPVENIKKQLDVMALFKINQFHWHLTEDQGWRVEIKKYPKLVEVGSKRVEGEGTEYAGFYTQEEIKEVVAYAAERFINVIPELELPGHELAAIAAYPELSCKGEPTTARNIWGVEDIVMCAGKEEVFQFLEDVIAELIPLFPGELFHIGGDECPKKSWKSCPRCQQRMRREGLKDEYELQSYFVQRIEKVLNGHGKRMIGWDEILEGGLAPSATVMSWRGEEGGIAAANMNHNVIMTPGSGGMYLDHYQGDSKIEPVAIGGYTTLEKTYGYNPVPDTLLKAGKAGFVKGVQCNIWSEYMYNTDLMEYRIYPRILALSEIAWSEPERKDFVDFARRIDNGYVRLDMHDIHYHIPQPEQPGGSCDKVAFTDRVALTFTTTRPIKMVYTLDDSDPSPASAYYDEPIVFDESGVLKIRSVLPSGKMSPVRRIVVDKQAFSPAKEVEQKQAGLEMKVTDGLFYSTLQLTAITEWKRLTLKDLPEITKRVKSERDMRAGKQYAAIASGYLEIPEDGVYFFSSDLEEVWMDRQLLITNEGETKRFSRHDASVALSKGLHEIKVVFLGHIMGGWPTNWNDGHLRMRRADQETFEPITPEQLFH